MAKKGVIREMALLNEVFTTQILPYKEPGVSAAPTAKPSKSLFAKWRSGIIRPPLLMSRKENVTRKVRQPSGPSQADGDHGSPWPDAGSAAGGF